MNDHDLANLTHLSVNIHDEVKGYTLHISGLAQL